MTDMTGKSFSCQIEVISKYNKQEGWERLSVPSPNGLHIKEYLSRTNRIEWEHTSLNNPSPYIISHS